MEQNLLGTGELGKSEFRGTGSFIFEQQGNNSVLGLVNIVLAVLLCIKPLLYSFI